eukprot:1993525-Amphidinium_carterae.1
MRNRKYDNPHCDNVLGNLHSRAGSQPASVKGVHDMTERHSTAFVSNTNRLFVTPMLVICFSVGARTSVNRTCMDCVVAAILLQ